MGKSHKLTTLAFGAAVGVGIGLLIAPKSGKETRKDLKEKFDELVQKVKELDAEEVKENLIKKIDEIKEGIADLDKEKVTSIAKEKAAKIKKNVTELYESAKEKTTPVVTKAVSDIKDKTISFLKKNS